MRSARGIAVLVVLIALVVVAVAVSVLVLTSTVETQIASTSRDSTVARRAAEAAASAAIAELASLPVTATLAGAVSAATDGPPTGVRTLANGSVLDLDAETAELTCGLRTPCSDADTSRVAEGRPWGGANPRWHIFRSGPLSTVATDGPQPALLYTIAWVADDPLERDGDVAADAPPGDPGHGVLLLAARAYGARGVRRTVQVAIERVGTEVRVLSVHERRP